MGDTAAAYRTWLMLPRPTASRWRLEARAAIRTAVLHSFGDCPERFSREMVIATIDAAYPFGERAMHPYKAWLAERKQFITDVLDPQDAPAPAPTAEDLAACEVAADILEEGAKDAEARARKLLDEQAPRRLARKCPACGAEAGKPCFDGDGATEQSVRPDGHRAGRAHPYVKQANRLVPHLARVSPPSSGPLFSPPDGAGR